MKAAAGQTHEQRDEVDALIQRTRVARGLPEVIVDADALARVAGVLRAAGGGPRG